MAFFTPQRRQGKHSAHSPLPPPICQPPFQHSGKEGTRAYGAHFPDPEPSSAGSGAGPRNLAKDFSNVFIHVSQAGFAVRLKEPPKALNPRARKSRRQRLANGEHHGGGSRSHRDKRNGTLQLWLYAHTISKLRPTLRACGLHSHEHEFPPCQRALSLPTRAFNRIGLHLCRVVNWKGLVSPASFTTRQWLCWTPKCASTPGSGHF